MKNCNVKNQGFLTRWLVSGLKSSSYESCRTEKDQIRYEQHLRTEGIDGKLERPPENIRLGEKGCGDCLWEYYYRRNHWFVDLSNTCPGPTKLEAYGATVLEAEEELNLEAVLWTYPAAEVWVNDYLACHVKKAVYKPMTRRPVTLRLKKGKNLIFVRIQTVGVRDSRNMFGIQIKEGLDERVKQAFPDEAGTAPVILAEKWLDEIFWKEDRLSVNRAPEFDAWLRYKGKDGRLLKERITEREKNVPEDVCRFQITVQAAGQELKRSFEIGERWKPVYWKTETREESHLKIYRHLAAIPYQVRGSGAHFSVYHVLARYALGMETREDREYLLQDLAYIDQRIDCSDFLMSGFIRLVKNYRLDEELMETVRQTFLNYRYWMDEDGSDGMCFWSENHALMFYGAQMAAGHLYPDEIFTRSGRTGREQAAVGEARCRSWLTEVENYGFEEFISATYTSVTVAALLNLIDFGPEDISMRAARVLDQNLEMLCTHVFDGVVIGPQGRVYRDVIYPFKQSAQAFVHFINPDLPTSMGLPGSECMWLSAMATTKYQIPDGLKKKMEEKADFSYTSQDAEIVIKKEESYILTSVASPRDNYEKKQEEGEIFGTAWVKELNTRYHGKTLFEPGVFGYQQHMWYAALAKDCPIFVNHPGISSDDGEMRPGYWYGNGIFPAVKQKGGMLGAIYFITEEHPIHFTHLYWPEANLDETQRQGSWIFGRKGNGYAGIWCSRELTPFDDVLFGREFRAYGSRTAYVCVCAGRKEAGNFDCFIKACLEKKIEFAPLSLRLTAEGLGQITYRAAQDCTQYI